MCNVRGDVQIFRFSAEYVQDVDSCSEESVIHQMDLKTEDAGGGRYYVMSTPRWAFESIDEIVSILEDFIDRAKIGVKDEEG